MNTKIQIILLLLICNVSFGQGESPYLLNMRPSYVDHELYKSSDNKSLNREIGQIKDGKKLTVGDVVTIYQFPKFKSKNIGKMIDRYWMSGMYADRFVAQADSQNYTTKDWMYIAILYLHAYGGEVNKEIRACLEKAFNSLGKTPDETQSYVELALFYKMGDVRNTKYSVADGTTFPRYKELIGMFENHSNKQWGLFVLMCPQEYAKGIPHIIKNDKFQSIIATYLSEFGESITRKEAQLLLDYNGARLTIDDKATLDAIANPVKVATAANSGENPEVVQAQK